MGKLRNTVFCIILTIFAFILISSYYLTDGNYNKVFSRFGKAPQHHRIKRPESCDYQACHPIKPGFLNVHLIPHSHDDMGWLKTMDEYYTGEGDPGVPFSVRQIISSVFEALQKNPDRRFIQVETGFFSKWWNEQNDTVKSVYKNLVKNGRIEFTGGAWAMNDEACAHYASIIDGFSIGLRLLNETFGECGRPRIGWQIDPFGHSKEMASIFAHMGYEAFMFARIDYQDHEKRQKERKLQMLWESSPNLGKASHIFTEMTNGLYNPPSGFCFDIQCHNEFSDYLGETFLGYINDQMKMYRSPNVPILFGGDFVFHDAEYYYKSIDRLIRYINNFQKNGSRVNLLYSTPSCYLHSVHESGITLPTKRDDFFPYGSGAHAYWTGYFTSRPALKFYERFSHNFLQICKQLYVLSNLKSDTKHNFEDDLNVLREALGVVQHHDGISGTAKQHPSDNYAELLSNGIQSCSKVVNEAFKPLMKDGKARNSQLSLESCFYLNVSSCHFTESTDKFVINVYNPLGQPVDRYVRIPVQSHLTYKVQNYKGDVVEIQTVPVHEKVAELPERQVERSASALELVFKASPPAMGYASYLVTSSEGMTTSATVKTSKDKFIGSQKFGLRFDTKGYICEFTRDNISVPMQQTFEYYSGHATEGYRSNDMTDISSGAYLFVPETQTPDKNILQSVGDVATIIYKGPLVEEVHQTYFTKNNTSFVSQVIRLYKDEEHFEFEWLVGPIPIEDQVGKEIITKYTLPSLDSKNTFYTDSNGREMVQRIKDYRSTWTLDNKEPIASNYYPVTSRIMIQDDGLQMSVLTDRAQGGSSLNKGEIEVMIHRRLLRDDDKGVTEPLNEPGFDGKGLVVRGKHWLTIGHKLNQSVADRDLSLKLLYSPWLFFVKVSSNVGFDQWKNQYRMLYSGLRGSLPNCVHVLNLEPWTGGTILLRLEHVLEADDQPEKSEPVSVDLDNFFHPFEIVSIEETTLGGTQWYADMARMHWTTDKEFNANERNADIEASIDRSSLDISNITLTPMMIRTFILTIEYS